MLVRLLSGGSLARVAGPLVLGGALLLAAGPATAHAPLTVAEPQEEVSGEGGVLAAAVVDVPHSPQQPRWFSRMGLGFAYRYAFGESMYGGALEGELGAQDLRLAGGVRLRIEAGSMDIGLRYQAVSFGPFLWLPTIAQRLRFGFGFDIGALVINRRTTPGSSMWTILFGGRLDGAVDLIHLGATGALQALASLSGQALTSAPGPLAVVTTIGLSYRP